MPSDAVKSRGKAKSFSSPHLQIALLLCTDCTTTGGHVRE